MDKNANKHAIAWPRMMSHWANLISIIALAVTGWYIHKPFAPGWMGPVRLIHFVFAYIFAINIILRIYYAFGKNGDWKKYLKPQINKETLKLTYRHYLLYDHLPEGEHYRILQNGSYLAVVLMFLLQVITGILLYNPEGHTTTQVIAALGGINLVRQLHLFFQWIFIAFTIVHVYMAITEDLPKVRSIFIGAAREE